MCTHTHFSCIQLCSKLQSIVHVYVHMCVFVHVCIWISVYTQETHTIVQGVVIQAHVHIWA